MKELTNKVLWCEALSRSLTWSSQYMASFLMFMLSYVTGGELIVAKVFSAYSVIAFIRLNFSHFHVHAMNFIVESRLLFQRLGQIMDITEMKDEIEFKKPESSENSVEFDGYTGFWIAGEKRIALENINLTLLFQSISRGISQKIPFFSTVFQGQIDDLPSNIITYQFELRNLHDHFDV